MGENISGNGAKIDRLLLVTCGSIGIVDMPFYLTRIREIAGSIRVVMTQSATRFVPSSTMSLFCDEVYPDDAREGWHADHLGIGKWAEVVAYLPASAQTIAAVANGDCSTLAGRLAISTTAPVVFFPNMNELMWEAKSVQRNVATLRSDGHIVVDPVRGPVFETSTGKTEDGVGAPTVDVCCKLLVSIARLGKSNEGASSNG